MHEMLPLTTVFLAAAVIAPPGLPCRSRLVTVAPTPHPLCVQQTTCR